MVIFLVGHPFCVGFWLLSFWVKIVAILSDAQLVTTGIFFSAWDKSHVKLDNSRNSKQKMRTIVTRKQKMEDLEIPIVTICPNFAFKPSINQQFDFPTRDLFIYSQETNQNLQSIFHGQTVLNVFKNFSYANDFSFRFRNNLNKIEFNLNPGENMVQRGHVSVNSVL